ncbi:hypothetical protein H4684_003164 [Desulfomicrobium macestii]|uniref:Uncharacterized protein n=1 Tax=Desulfomicrobium macestii TaxID=90731 RepID=A0ABR9H717_9BACT|nr:hypothetical protein [Desulfomicrobium macestii]MBE1426498.1 hypothetical protein [Desulfomicrobium macestii]
MLKIFAWSCPIPDDLTEASINTESAAIVRKIQPEMPFQAVLLRPGTELTTSSFISKIDSVIRCGMLFSECFRARMLCFSLSCFHRPVGKRTVEVFVDKAKKKRREPTCERKAIEMAREFILGARLA